MGDDITIGVTEIVNNIEVTAQPNDQIVDISVTDNADNVTLNITPTVVEVNINKGSSFARWGDLYGTLSDQTDLQNALNLKANLVGGKVPASELPSYVDDIIEVANYAALPATGETGKIYVTLDNNKIYRWSGSIYIEIASNSAIWGAITGTLSSQTDLVNALNLRVPYTGATSNVNLGEYGLTSGFLGLDTTPTSTPTGIGTIYWDAANRTAALIDGDGDTTLQIGQEQRILVHNNTGSTLTDGQVVYVTGSTGNLPSVSLANASSETTSAATIGVVTESIAQGADGFITTSGIVNGLNTLAFNEGDLLWLGTTAGTFTATKPISPNHLVLIGYVIKKAGGNGSILVKIQNTQELEESSDVLFTSLTNKDFLVYESSTDLWKNKSLGTVLGGTSSQFVKGNGTLDSTAYVSTARTLTINGTAYDLTADRSWTIATHNPVGIGTSNGLSIDSNQQLSLALASTSTNGALSSTDWNTFNGKQNALTNPVTGTGTTNYLPKFTGASAIGNSQIYDNGTNVGIGTTSPNQLLHIEKDQNTYTNLRVRNNDAGSSAYTMIGLNSSGNSWGMRMGSSAANSNRLDFVIDAFGSPVERMSITSGGNVGIGTTSPSSLLHLYVPTGTLYQTLESNVINQTVGTITKTPSKSFFTGQNYSVTNNWEVYDITSSASRLSISPTGNVGIGTTSPVSKLNVSGDNITVSAGYGIAYAGDQTRIFTPEDNVSGGLLNWGSGGILRFKSGTSERMRIDGSGNVGIGTTSPSTLFHIYKASFPILTIQSSSYQSSLGIDTTSGNLVLNNESNAPLSFNTNATERMRITSGGNIGIRTTSPESGWNVDIAGIVAMGSTAGNGRLYVSCANTTNGITYIQARNLSVGTPMVYLASSHTFDTNVTAPGFFNSSDIRLKDLIDYNYNVLDIKPITYLWKDGRDNKKHVGYSAQEVQKVMPDAVNEDEKGFLSVNYVEVLVAKIEAMEKEIAYLKSKI